MSENGPIDVVKKVENPAGEVVGYEDYLGGVSTPVGSEDPCADNFTCESEPSSRQDPITAVLLFIPKIFIETFINPVKEGIQRIASTASNIVEGGKKLIAAAAEKTAEEKNVEGNAVAASKKSIEHYVDKAPVAKEPVKTVSVETSMIQDHTVDVVVERTGIPVVSEVFEAAVEYGARAAEVVLKGFDLSRIAVSAGRDVARFTLNLVDVAVAFVKKAFVLVANVVERGKNVIATAVSHHEKSDDVMSGEKKVGKTTVVAVSGTEHNGGEGKPLSALVDMRTVELRRMTGESGHLMAHSGALNVAMSAISSASERKDVGGIAGLVNNVRSAPKWNAVNMIGPPLLDPAFPVDMINFMALMAGCMVYVANSKGSDSIFAASAATDPAGHEKQYAEQIDAVGGSPDEGFSGSDNGNEQNSHSGHPNDEQLS